MRGFIFLIIAAAAIVALTLKLTNVDLPGISTVRTQPKPELAAEPEQKAQPASKPKRPQIKSPQQVEIASVADAPLTAPSPPSFLAETPRIPRRFPSAQEVRTGMNRSELRKLYGEPTLLTLQTTGGQLIERYIYIRSDRAARFTAVLENGRIVRSEVGSY